LARSWPRDHREGLLADEIAVLVGVRGLPGDEHEPPRATVLLLDRVDSTLTGDDVAVVRWGVEDVVLPAGHPTRGTRKGEVSVAGPAGAVRAQLVQVGHRQRH